MNDYGSLAYGSRCYEQLRALDDMKSSMSCSQDSRCFEQLQTIDDMNDSKS